MIDLAVAYARFFHSCSSCANSFKACRIVQQISNHQQRLRAKQFLPGWSQEAEANLRGVAWAWRWCSAKHLVLYRSDSTAHQR